MAALTQDAFVPRLLLCFKDYSWGKFSKDLIAGTVVGFVALPLAMAFAISSGVPPMAGLTCAVVAGFLISALGGSTYQIGGPTGAFVVVVAGIVGKHGLDGLYMCTLMAGVVLILLGMTGLGSAVKFIPRPVVIGFTNGIAVLIASTQIKDLFGLTLAEVPGEFGARMAALAGAAGTAKAAPTLVALGSLLLMVAFMRWLPKVPGAIVALMLGTTAAWVAGLPIETIGDRFGHLPSGLPAVVLPTFRMDLVLPLLSPAFTVAMLGAIESLLSATVADKAAGDRHNPNVELFAQGVANVASPLVGGLPATGAIARTATNIRSGAQTPVAGMVHALVLLVVLLAGAPLAEHIPLSVLAAILLVVAYNMGEWKEVPEILKLSRADIAVWFITFALTVFADLTVAVEAGMILAALTFIRKVTTTSTVSEVTEEYVQEGMVHSLQANPIPEGVIVFRIHGPFLFGAVDKLAVIEEQIEDLPPVVVLRLRNMTAIDATGLHALEGLADKLRASGRQLVLCGAREQPMKLMNQAEFHRHVGAENIVPHLQAAIERSRQLLATS